MLNAHTKKKSGNSPAAQFDFDSLKVSKVSKVGDRS